MPGIALTSLQMTLKVAGAVYIPAFTKIYQNSLTWFPGLVFMISSVITVISMIPIRYTKQKTTERPIPGTLCLIFILCVFFLQHCRLQVGSEARVHEDSGRLKKHYRHEQRALFITSKQGNETQDVT